MSEPSVLVVVPMYESEATVGAAVRSALALEGVRVRVVVVDDGSTDGGAGVVRGIAGVDGRVELVSKSNGGLASARNAGVAVLERGDVDAGWVVFLDADDELLPGGVRALIDGHGGGAWEIACGGAGVVDGSGAAIGAAGIDGLGVGGGVFGWRALLGFRLVLTHCQVMPAGLVRRFRYDEGWGRGEDYELYLRMAFAGVRWRGVDAEVGRYTVRGGSLCSDFGGMLRSSVRLLERWHGEAVSRGGWTDADGRGVVRGVALGYASRAALADGVEAGVAMYRAGLGMSGFSFGGSEGLVGAPLAGRCGWDALLFGAGVEPGGSGAGSRRGRERLLGFWGALESAGLGEAGLAGRAWEALWAEALPRRERARRLVDAALACGVGSIEVVGFGANGALVVEEALGRGARVRVRDERLDAGALRLPARAGLTAAGWGEGFVGGSAVVVSVGDDARVVSRLGGALAGVGRVLRWSSVSGEAVRDVGG